MTKPIKRADRWLKNIAREYVWNNEKPLRTPIKVARELVRRGLCDTPWPLEGVYASLFPTMKGLAAAARLGLRAPRKP